MNRKFFRLSCSGLYILICSLIQNTVASQDNADWYGVWWRGGPDAKTMKENYPWIKGVFVGMDWALVEPKPGELDHNGLALYKCFSITYTGDSELRS